jgi:hypothetical protein
MRVVVVKAVTVITQVMVVAVLLVLLTPQHGELQVVEEQELMVKVLTA